MPVITKTKSFPDFSLEKSYGILVAGIDEAGRGPLAGPVVAAAVVFECEPDIKGINDSKKLDAAKREELFNHITAMSSYGIGIASVQEIDSINILQATFLAMRRAFEALKIKPQAALVDGNRAPKIPCKIQTVVKGDSKSISIAAASILAKVTRDRIMSELAEEHPHYGWEKNAGYGTELHLSGIENHGITPHHRRTFSPIKEIVQKNQFTLELSEVS